MRTDVHQHLLPEDLISALSRRTQAPRITNDALHLAGEPPSAVRPRGPRPDHPRRARRRRPHRHRPVERRSASRASRPTRPSRSSTPSTTASSSSASRSRCGAPSASTRPRAADVDDLLDAGALGVSLPAAALADRRGLRHVAPLLDRLEARGAPLFVHPGPGVAAGARRALDAAVVARADDLRRRHERGLARLRDVGPPVPPAAAGRLRDARRRRAAARRAAASRAAARPAAIHDPLAWFDVSSYGPLALDAMIRTIGIDRLALRLRPPGRRAARARRARRRRRARADRSTNPEWAFSPRGHGAGAGMNTAGAQARSSRAWRRSRRAGAISSSTTARRARTPSCCATTTSPPG